MKRSNLFILYLVYISAVSAVGFLSDGILGIWRQGIVGVLMIVPGVIIRRNPVKPIRKETDRLTELSATLLFSCGVLMVVTFRLLSANLFHAALPYKNVSLLMRFVGTVLLPAMCAPLLAFHVFPSLCSANGKMVKVLLGGVAFTPFCSVWTHLPGAFLLGATIAACALILEKNRVINTFVAFLLLMFYDTLSISVGSLDFNLSVRQAFAFALMAVSFGVIVCYLALRTCKERRLRIGEFLTALLISSVILLVGIAL